MMAQVRPSHRPPSPNTRTHTHSSDLWTPLLRFLWRGLWAVSSTVTMATLLFGSRSSSVSPLLCWCTSTTTTSYITEGRHSDRHARSSVHTWTRRSGNRLFHPRRGKLTTGYAEVFPENACCQSFIRVADSFRNPREFTGLPKGPDVLLKWNRDIPGVVGSAESFQGEAAVVCVRSP